MSEEWEELPEGWEWATLESVLESHRGGVWGPEAENGKGYPVLRSTNMRGSKLDFSEIARCEISDEVAKSAALKQGDIIVSKSSGSPHLVGLPALFEGSPDGQIYLYSNFTMRLRPIQERILPRYLFHFLAGAKAEADRRTMSQDTAGLRNLKTSEYLSQVLPRPPLPEQHHIVEKIERLFAESCTAREALDKVPALLKRFRQSVLAKAFRGELTERDPSDEPASVLLERIREGRRRKWEKDLRAKGKDPKKAKYVEPQPPNTSDLPELPEGWEWTTVEQIGSVNDEAVKTGPFGAQLSSKEFTKAGIPILAIGNVQWGKLALNKQDFVTEAKANQLADYRLKPGDVLFTRSGTVGRSAVVPKDADGWLMSYHLLRVRADAQTCLPDYLYYVFRGEVGIQEEITERARGATRAGFNTTLLKTLPIPLAPLAEQHRIVAKIESLFAQAEAIERAVEVARRRATKVDQAVLVRAFRGEL